MKGIYLGAYKSRLKGDLDYNDIKKLPGINKPGDMMKINLNKYDYIIATPPCNYYSRANWRREKSEYSQKTKKLLPGILKKLMKMDKPFIVENVRNAKIFTEKKLFDLPCFIYMIGRHTYWTNIMIPTDIEQKPDNIHYISSKDRQGGENVDRVLQTFINIIGA